MTSRSLVSLAVLLALGLASAYVLDDTYPETDTMEDMATTKIEEEMLDEMSTLDKIHDRSLPKKPVNDRFNLKKIRDRSMPKEPLVEEDVPASIKDLIDRLKDNCDKPHVPFRSKKKERKSALRKSYQALIHFDKNFIGDSKWKASKKSELCCTCVLNALCKNASVQAILNINSSFPE